MKQYFRNPRGMWTNVLALAYTLLGYAAGIVMLTADSWWINAVGVFLTGHAMVYAAYFVHEFSHQSVFKSGDANNRWGTLMMWPTGVVTRSLRRYATNICAIILTGPMFFPSITKNFCAARRRG